MARRVEQAFLADVRRVHELVAGLLVPAPGVRLQFAPDDSPLRVEYGEAGTELVREAEQVQLGTEPAMVAAFGLGQELHVRLQRLLGLPCRAVDPLQLRVVLVTAPVRGRDARQLERRDVLRGRHVRAPAQIAPDPVAAARIEIVVDRQLARAVDLHHLGRVDIGLEVDQFQLVRLIGQFLLGRVDRVDHSTGEPLRALDDLVHALLERGQVFRCERAVGVEVVVEAVLDGRADAQLGVRELLLHGLGEHVRAGVPQHGSTVVGVGGDRLDLDVLVRHPGQVAQAAVRLADDQHRVRALAGQPSLPHRRAGGGARRNHHACGADGGGTDWLGHDDHPC